MTTQEKIDFYFDQFSIEEWEQCETVQDIKEKLQGYLECEVMISYDQLDSDFAFVLGPEDFQLDSKDEVMDFIREYGYDITIDEPEFLIVR